jgi:hypothetical protein
MDKAEGRNKMWKRLKHVPGVKRASKGEKTHSENQKAYQLCFLIILVLFTIHCAPIASRDKKLSLKGELFAIFHQDSGSTICKIIQEPGSNTIIATPLRFVGNVGRVKDYASPDKRYFISNNSTSIYDLRENTDIAIPKLYWFFWGPQSDKILNLDAAKDSIFVYNLALRLNQLVYLRREQYYYSYYSDNHIYDPLSRPEICYEPLGMPFWIDKNRFAFNHIDSFPKKFVNEIAMNRTSIAELTNPVRLVNCKTFSPALNNWNSGTKLERYFRMCNKGCHLRLPIPCSWFFIAPEKSEDFSLDSCRTIPDADCDSIAICGIEDYVITNLKRSYSYGTIKIHSTWKNANERIFSRILNQADNKMLIFSAILHTQKIGGPGEREFDTLIYKLYLYDIRRNKYNIFKPKGLFEQLPMKLPTTDFADAGKLPFFEFISWKE